MSKHNKWRNFRSACLLVFLWACLLQPLFAEEYTSTSSFVGAERLQQGELDYPTSQRRANNSGIVEMVLMVGTDGAVFEPMVTHSTKPQFEKAALKALDGYHFSPALLNGEPVESIYELRVMFMMGEGKTAVSSNFSKRFERAKIELEKEPPDQDKMVKAIEEVANSNNLSPYAYAQLNQARLEYAVLFGGTKERIEAIESMLLFEGRVGLYGPFLDRLLRQSMRNKLFELNVQARLYGDAFHAYNRLQEIDPTAEQKHGEALKKINTIRSRDKAVTVDLDIHARGHTEVYLFRQTFYLSEVQGELSSVKLRCRNKFIELDLPFETEYEIPRDWGYCNLQVIGTPETKFKLVQ